MQKLILRMSGSTKDQNYEGSHFKRVKVQKKDYQKGKTGKVLSCECLTERIVEINSLHLFLLYPILINFFKAIKKFQYSEKHGSRLVIQS